VMSSFPVSRTGEHGDKIFGEIKPLKYFLRARPNGGLSPKTGGIT
jgi:hypothetical protein